MALIGICEAVFQVMLCCGNANCENMRAAANEISKKGNVLDGFALGTLKMAKTFVSRSWKRAKHIDSHAGEISRDLVCGGYE